MRRPPYQLLLFLVGTALAACGESADTQTQDAAINDGSAGGSHDAGDADVSMHPGDGSADAAEEDGSITDAASGDSGLLSDAQVIPDLDARDVDAVANDGGAHPCASPAEDPSCETMACAAIDGKTFESTVELECGNSPGGLVYCHWSVSFDAGDFQWHHSDVGDSGVYTCDGLTISAMSGSAAFSGSYDPVTQKLLWQGNEYAARP